MEEGTVSDGSAARASAALLLAAKMADTANEALALMREADEKAVVSEAEMVLRMSSVSMAMELAYEALAELQADGGIEYGSDAPAEKRPSYWVGRLEGALGALVSAVEDAQRE